MEDCLKRFNIIIGDDYREKDVDKTSVQQNEFTNDDDEQGYKGIKLQLCISFYHYPLATKSV